MVEIVPEGAWQKPAIGAHHKNVPAGPEHSVHGRHDQLQRLLVRQVFEEVRGEDNIHAFGRYACQLLSAAAHRLDSGGSVHGQLWIRVHGDAAGGTDVVDELAEARSQVQYDVIRTDIAGEEVVAQHLPNRQLALLVGWIKAVLVDGV